MINIIIVRHGKTDWNEKQLMQGKTDIPLNNDGINDAKVLASIIKDKKIDLCFCSPLIRAQQTAKILMDESKIIIDDSLVERDFGELEGKKIVFDHIEEYWDYKLNYKGQGIESIQDCLKRAKRFLDKIKTYNNKTILIVSHGAFIKALHFNLIGYDKNTDFLSFNPKNTTIYEYTLN